MTDIIEQVIQVAKEAAIEINEIYNHADYQVEIKSDSSPVTKADMASNRIICDGLGKITPDIPILSEEGHKASFSERKKWKKYWLIDPLDGTKEFINKTDEFTINIALVADGVPVIGVVMVPALDQCYFAKSKEKAFWMQGDNEPKELKVKKASKKTKVVISSFHKNSSSINILLDDLGDFELIRCGSTLKIMKIARGLADIYPRFAPTSEWDTAAGQCILEQAGGMLIDLYGNPLKYNLKESLVNPSFLAIGSLNNNIVENLPKYR